jgi:glutamine cyclotransferase
MGRPGVRAAAERNGTRRARVYRQGLVYLPERGTLLESVGLYGESELREVELSTGRVLRRGSRLQGQFFAEGIAVIPKQDAWRERVEGAGSDADKARRVSELREERGNSTVLQLTWREKKAFEYRLDTFARQRYIGYQTTPGHDEGWGLTLDAARGELVVSDGSDHLFRWDAWTFAERGRVRVMDRAKNAPLRNLNELEFVCGEVLANVWYMDHLVRLDPVDGHVIGTLDMARLHPRSERTTNEDVLNGIAVDPRTMFLPVASSTMLRAPPTAYDPVADGSWPGGVRLFVTGKRWNYLYEISLETRDAPSPTARS